MYYVNHALVIIDMSNDFVYGTLPVGDPAANIVPYLIDQAEAFITNGGTVIFTMDAHLPNDSHFNRWPAHNVVGTEGQQLYGKLKDWYEAHKELPNVWYVPKTDYDAFHKTDLEERLREKGITKIHATGVCTDICVFLTVHGADARHFDTAVHARGVATFTDKGPAFLEHMKACFHTEIVE